MTCVDMLKYLERWRSNDCLDWIKEEITSVHFEITTNGDKFRFEVYFETSQPSGYVFQEEIIVTHHKTFEKCVEEAYNFIISKKLEELKIVRVS